MYYIFIRMIESSPKLTISVRPPLPNHKGMQSPRSPFLPTSPTSHPFARKTSANKSSHKPSLEKSKQEEEFQKVIKYSKNPKPQAKQESSLIESQHTFAGSITHHLDDSRETVQRINTFSRDSKPTANRRRQASVDKGALKLFDSVDNGNPDNNKRGCPEKNEEYYLYWKNKAHEYLESNIKFMEQINKLTRENEALKQTISTLSFKEKQDVKVAAGKQQQQSQSLREISLHYLNKIGTLEKQLKRKELVIQSFQLKFKEMSQAISGDQDRIKLINRMKAQIQELKIEKSNKIAEINPIVSSNSISYRSPNNRNIGKSKPKYFPHK